jgi:serine/threonine protein kinase
LFTRAGRSVRIVLNIFNKINNLHLLQESEPLSLTCGPFKEDLFQYLTACYLFKEGYEVAASAGGLGVTTEEGKPGLVEKGTAVLAAGTRLGEYEIERLLGVGSMGAVYEGVCTATSQRFAIKVLSPALAAMPTARARFLNEAKLTQRVRHPHIVDVSDVGEDAGRSFFVMELLSGEDLSRRLHRSGPLSVVETADIVVPVCDAVAEAHRRGVTHRDLKPSNIFLLVRGRRPHPVVLDFGIAKEEDAASVRSVGGATPGRRMVFGTPYYLAPEQLADHEAAGPVTDQYALGVILYECLTGHPPFVGDDVDAVFRAIAAGNPVPPIALRPEIPPEMNAIVLRALSPEPRARYQSVGELRQALLPFSSKATGSVPTLQSRFATAARPAAAARSPAPSGEVEAQAPRSFVRTLTPEVEALDGAWFAAGEAAQESAGPAAIPSALAAGRESNWEPSGATVPPVEVESAGRAIASGMASGIASGMAKLVARRVWIGAAAAFAVGSFALVFVVKSGGSSHSEKLPLPAATLVQIEPTPAAPVPAVPPAAAANEAPILAVPTPVPSEAPTASATAASEAPTLAVPPPAPSEAPVLAPPAPKKVPIAAAAPAPRERPIAAKREAAPREPAPRARLAATPSAKALPATATATATSAVAGPSAKRRPSPDKPRAGASGGVRMHNGVPLLD